MYLTILYLHSWLRWVVLLSAIWAIASAIRGVRDPSAVPRSARTALKLFAGTLDLQILLGLLLYFFLSPYTPNSLAAFGQSMKVGVLRYFAVEHPLTMVIAAGVAHVGLARARKAPDERLRQRRILVWVGVALALILIAIPWPFLPAARPLLRLS